MDVIWFTQSKNGTEFEVIHSGVAVLNRDARIRLASEVESGIKITDFGEWGLRFSWIAPCSFWGFLRPDVVSGNGRIRVGAFKVTFVRTDSTDAIVKSLGYSLDCLGIESSEDQQRRFLSDVSVRLVLWRRLRWGAIGLLSVLVAIGIVVFSCF